MKPKAETTAVPLGVIGVDIGKDVFHLVGLGVDGKIAVRNNDPTIGPPRRLREVAAMYRRHGGLPERAFR